MVRQNHSRSSQPFQIIKPKCAQYCTFVSAHRPSIAPAGIEKKKTVNHAQFRTKSEQTAKLSVPQPLAPEPPFPTAEGRPGGGDGFVRSKSMCIRNSFPTKHLEARKPARNSPFRARISKPPHHTNPRTTSPPTTNPAGQKSAWGGDGFVRSKSVCIHNPFPTRHLEARKTARSSLSRARISKAPQSHYPPIPWPLSPIPAGQRPAFRPSTYKSRTAADLDPCW